MAKLYQPPTPHFTSFSHVLAWQCSEGYHSDLPALLYGTPDGQYAAPLTYYELHAVTSQLAHRYAKESQRLGCVPTTLQPTVPVGMYGGSSLMYALTLIAIMKLTPRYIPFTISPRNSPAAVQHLCGVAGAQVILRGPEPPFVTATDAMIQCKAITHVLPLPTMSEVASMIQDIRSARQPKSGGYHGEQLQHADSESKYEERKSGQSESLSQQYPEPDPEAVVLLMHSSGSTQAYPKLIKLPNRYINAKLNDKKGWDMYQGDVIYATAPMFHALGAIFMFAAAKSSATLALPAVKVFPPTSQMLLDNIKACKATVAILLPFFLENMYHEAQNHGDHSYLNVLKSCREVTFGGATVSPHVGNELFELGVPLVDIYGSTEAGRLTVGAYNRPTVSKQRCTGRDAFAHVQLAFAVKYRLELHSVTETGAHQYELIVSKDHPGLALDQSNTDSGDYNVGDVFERVECVDDGRECFLIQGRVDDVIVHSTGEKTNPLPMEAAIRKECHAVEGAVVGGNNHFNTYALIELKKGCRCDDITVEQVWQAIRRANEDAPSHSHVLREMFIIMKEGDVLPRSDKGSIKRKVAEAQHREQIDRLYAGFGSDDSSTKAVDKSQQAVDFKSKQELSHWLQTSVKAMLAAHYGADNERAAADIPTSASIFDIGFDSLLAAQLYYRHIQPALPQLQLQPNIVYLHSDVDSLSDKLWQLQGGASSGAAADSAGTDAIYQQSEALYQKYTSLMTTTDSKLEYHAPTDGESVVVTGCTGSLGSFLICNLLHSPKVKHVYALVRASSSGLDDIRQTLIDAMEERAINTRCFVTERNLTVLACDLTADHLGLSTEQYHEICSTATSIIHNSWLMNFNRGVQDFDASCIRPSYELLRIASTQRIKQFFFVSSIGAVMNAAGPSNRSVLEQPVTDQHAASPMGYGQSKLVTERIATEYAKRFHVPVTIARVGQVGGDSTNGVWNTSEHISLMIQAATVMGVMPSQYMSLDALPVDVVAQTFVHLLTDCPPPDAATHNSGAAYARVFHVLNPVKLPWAELLSLLRSPAVKLPAFRIVEPRVWLQELSKPEHSDPKTNPMVKLRPYWESVFGGAAQGDNGTGHSVDFDTKQTQALAPDMRYELTEAYWSQVIRRWRAIGFITA